MIKKRYKDSNDEITLFGMGLMRLPKLNPDEPNIDREHALKMVQYAYESGINYYDTAYSYHNGESELFIGEAMKDYPRDSYYLASKMPTWLLEKPEDLQQYFEEQLEKCQVDYFDFYLCHAIGKDNFKVYEDGGYDYLRQEQKKGRIKYLGFSYHGMPDELDRITTLYPWDFAQIQINYLDWENQKAKEQYEICTKKGIPVIVMEPVRGGSLITLCPESIDILKTARPDASIGSWGLRFAGSLDNAMLVLSGSSSIEQIEENIEVFKNFEKITEQDLVTLDQAVKAYEKTKTIPCTLCNYCSDCPESIEIPKIFDLYNQFLIADSADSFIVKNIFLERYNGLKKKADACIACGACESRCPQSLPIIQHLDEVVKAEQKALEEPEA